MKKFLIGCFIFLILPSNATTFNLELAFDWINLSQVQRDKLVLNLFDKIFDDNFAVKYKNEEFKTCYKEFLKDSDYTKHYKQAIMLVEETKDYNLSAFFLKNKNFLYMYALQYKNNPYTAYYYDASGRLRYVDIISDNYPNFPYYSYQFNLNGTLVSAVYFESPDIQFMFNKKQEFVGVWIKKIMYNAYGKKIMTRSNY